MSIDKPDDSPSAYGVVSRPEWQAQEGLGHAWTLAGVGLAAGANANTTYLVPTGRTLYITQASCAVWGNLAADRDKHQIVELEVTANYIGGHGGCQIIAPTPLRFPAGITVTFQLTNRSNHAMDYHATFRGYEVE